MAEFLKRASEQYTLAANVLDASLTALKVKTGKPDEISDLEEMLKEVREKVEEVDGMAKAAEKAAEGSSSGSGSSTNGFDKPSVGGSTTTIGFGNGGGGGGGGGGRWRVGAVDDECGGEGSGVAAVRGRSASAPSKGWKAAVFLDRCLAIDVSVGALCVVSVPI